MLSVSYAECQNKHIMLSVIMLCVVALNVVMLSVVVPFYEHGSSNIKL